MKRIISWILVLVLLCGCSGKQTEVEDTVAASVPEAAEEIPAAEPDGTYESESGEETVFPE